MKEWKEPSGNRKASKKGKRIKKNKKAIWSTKVGRKMKELYSGKASKSDVLKALHCSRKDLQKYKTKYPKK